MTQSRAIFDKVDKLLDELYPQMEQDLLQLLRFATVREEPREGAPFGRPIAQALDYCLKLSAGFGLTTENIDGYMGVADLPGIGAEQVGVLTHIDVVPANAADWRHDPYNPVVAAGRIYGRGALDNKGPLVASLYAGVALARCTAPLPKTVRFMFGCDEESDFACLSHYLQTRQPPGCGFSPDASFPLVIGEKGLGSYTLQASWSAEDEEGGLLLNSLVSGVKGNIVPDRAEALFTIHNQASFPELTAAKGIEIQRDGEELRITAMGKAAHASLPHEGDNALAKLLIYISKFNFAPKGAKAYIDTLTRLLADSSYGESLGVAATDKYSRLTNVPSLMRLSTGSGELTCDMRFPVTHKAADYLARLQRIAEDNGLVFADWESQAPLFATEEHPVAAALLKAYRDFTGDISKPEVVGGGTYAKMMPNFFAFGPCFKGNPYLAHQADEYIECEEWLQTAKIYARAIYELAQ